MSSTDHSVSIVIPSLGGRQLEATLAAINQSTVVPNEILLCIPDECEIEANISLHANVELVRTQVKGQVAQRAIGLSKAASRYIVQMDDDIVLEKDCLAEMLAAGKRQGHDSAISPAFIHPETGRSIYSIETGSMLRKLYYRMLNGRAGYQPGAITRAGTCFGIDPSEYQQSEIETEWLPGGCVLHNKDNVVSENYFPFAGKAYSEDLYFSRIARSKGIKLFISRDSRCLVEPMPALVSLTLGELLHTLAGDLKPRKYFVKQTGRSLVRMYLFYVICIFSFLFGRAHTDN